MYLNISAAKIVRVVLESLCSLHCRIVSQQLFSFDVIVLTFDPAMRLPLVKCWKQILNSSGISNYNCRYVSYVQGQEPEPKIREYFYYIDHQGMLFLDDARMKNFTSCFKDKKFLQFFFTRVRMNTTVRYSQDFPFISPCGRERNFIRCDDLPIVYTHILVDRSGKEKLSYAHAGDLLVVDFQPDKIYMSPESGRVYHPAWDQVGKIGLIRSKLAIELSKNFEFNEGENHPPTHFVWNGVKLKLDRDWVRDTILSKRLSNESKTENF